MLTNICHLHITGGQNLTIKHFHRIYITDKNLISPLAFITIECESMCMYFNVYQIWLKNRLLKPVYSDAVSDPRVGSHGSALPPPRIVSRTIHPDEGYHDHAATILLIS